MIQVLSGTGVRGGWGVLLGWGVLAGGLMMLGGCGTWEAYRTMPGPDFLWIYGVCLGVLVLGFLCSILICKWVPRVDGDALDVVEVAYLMGGGRHMVHTALVSLKAKGYLEAFSPRVEKGRGGGNGERLLGVERELLRLCGPSQSVGEVVALMQGQVWEVRKSLEARNYLIAKEKVNRVVGPWLMGLVVLMASGGYRVWLGVHSGKPYFFLEAYLLVSAVLLILGTVIWALMQSRVGRRTVGGRRFLEERWDAHREEVVERGLPPSAGAGAIGLAFALFGPAVMVGVMATDWGAIKQSILGEGVDLSVTYTTGDPEEVFSVNPRAKNSGYSGGACGSGGGGGGGDGGGGGCGGGSGGCGGGA